LSDGTALPGVAFISNVQPSFSSQSLSSIPDKIDSPLAPLTLAKEQQDELSLSIEMVRHAPINVVEIIEKVERNEMGTMVKPRNIVSSNPRENSNLFRVCYEASGGIRMYVDPAFPSTVAYMERLFCYDEEEEVEEDGEDRDITGAKKREYRSTNNVMVLSLDKSYRYTLHPTTDVGDVFTEEDNTSVRHPFKGSANGAAIEAVIMGVKTQDENGMALELHVGQKVVRKVTKEENNAISLDQKIPSRFGMRPDDPAPRGESHLSLKKMFLRIELTFFLLFRSLSRSFSKVSVNTSA